MQTAHTHTHTHVWKVIVSDWRCPIPRHVVSQDQFQVPAAGIVSSIPTASCIVGSGEGDKPLALIPPLTRLPVVGKVVEDSPLTITRWIDNENLDFAGAIIKFSVR